MLLIRTACGPLDSRTCWSQTDNLETGIVPRTCAIEGVASVTQNHVSRNTEIVWSCVEDGFYVASCAERFLGFVDRIDSADFQVCDAHSQQIGIFTTLAAAQSFLVDRAAAESSVSATREEA